MVLSVTSESVPSCAKFWASQSGFAQLASTSPEIRLGLTFSSRTMDCPSRLRTALGMYYTGSLAVILRNLCQRQVCLKRSSHCI